VALSGGAIVFGLVAGQLIAGGHSGAVLGLAVVLLPVALWKRPEWGPAVLLGAALMIEQVGQGVQPADTGSILSVALTPAVPLTSQIPLFQGLGSVHLNGADLLLVTVLIIYLAHNVDRQARRWPRSQVAIGVAALTGAVALGTVVGLSHHGSLRIALMETRPFVYLAATYVLTTVLVNSRAALRASLWVLVVASGLKALQGLDVYLKVRNMNPRPETILGHEEAYFFAVFLFLVIALWLFDVPGRLRQTATWLTPIVVAADLANNRRTAWLVLAAGLVALAAIGFRCLPSRRRAIGRGAVIVLCFSAVYLPVFWNGTGGLAQPARALKSVISPDPRDASSDLYRTQENANLKFNIKQGGVIGKGFGVPIDYALPIANISQIDPLIAYIPHNGVLYVLMRMGILGGLALWTLLGAGLVAGCRLARAVDRELAVVGAVLACALIAYALEGATDQGFFFYRIAIVTGFLLGLAEAARRLARP